MMTITRDNGPESVGITMIVLSLPYYYRIAMSNSNSHMITATRVNDLVSVGALPSLLA